jgi:hypothetical protein
MPTCVHPRTKRRRPAVLTVRGVEAAASTQVECQDCHATWQEWPDGRRSEPITPLAPAAPGAPDPDAAVA